MIRPCVGLRAKFKGLNEELPFECLLCTSHYTSALTHTISCNTQRPATTYEGLKFSHFMRKLRDRELGSQTCRFLSFNEHQGLQAVAFFSCLLGTPPPAVLCLAASGTFRALFRSQGSQPHPVWFLSPPTALNAVYAICSGFCSCTLDLFGPQFPLCNEGGKVGKLLEAPLALPSGL